MMTDRTRDATARLAFLRARFATRLRARGDELASALAVQRAPAHLAAAQRLAHTMSGTAGSYGYVRVGEAAAGLERAIVSYREGDGTWIRVQFELDAVLELCRQAASDA